MWRKWRHWILVICALDHFAALGGELPTFPSDHLDELTGRGGEGIHPPTKSSIPRAFWRTRAVHLAGREIEHLFFMEREWAPVKWDRRVSAAPARSRRVCLRAAMTDSRSEAAARWLTPALSDWQRRTHHRSSYLVINSVYLVLKVEATVSAGRRCCSLKSSLHKGGRCGLVQRTHLRGQSS